MIDQLLKVQVESESDEGISYVWLLDGTEIAQTKSLEYMFEEVGEYELTLRVSQGESRFDYPFTVTVTFENIEPAPEGATAYVTKVFDFVPAVGQFTNTLPVYKEGDTQEAMNEKVLAAIGNNKKGMISLGGFGGYVVVGFDHTITNVTGKRDFRVLGKLFILRLIQTLARQKEEVVNRELSWWLMIKIRMGDRMMMNGMKLLVVLMKMLH